FTCEPGPTGIALDVAKLPVQFGIRPLVEIDGRPVPNVSWGVGHIPVHPGYHQLTVSTSQLGMEYGRAQIIVPVPEGHITRVYYRSPIERYGAGAMGPQPQASPGMVVGYAATVLSIILFALVAVA